MQSPLRSFFITAGAVWVLVCITGFLYSQQQHIPARIAAAATAALLLETLFYVAIGFGVVRSRLLEAARPAVLAACLTASAVLPYCLYSVFSGVFAWTSLGTVALAGGAVAFWFVLFPNRGVFNLAFLALMAGAVIAKVVTGAFTAPHPELRLEFMGQLMWIRMGAASALLIGRMEGTGFGFLPSRKDWLIGLRYFLYLVPVSILLAYALGFARFQPDPNAWWRALPIFLGMLWVVALSEEFFFRGLLQRWLGEWSSSETFGLVAASLLFGSVHLWFRTFPNWQFALLAAVAGLFYGRAFQKAGSIRAAMVAHALLSTTWRSLFTA